MRLGSVVLSWRGPASVGGGDISTRAGAKAWAAGAGGDGSARGPREGAGAVCSRLAASGATAVSGTAPPLREERLGRPLTGLAQDLEVAAPFPPPSLPLSGRGGPDLAGCGPPLPPERLERPALGPQALAGELPRPGTRERPGTRDRAPPASRQKRRSPGGGAAAPLAGEGAPLSGQALLAATAAAAAERRPGSRKSDSLVCGGLERGLTEERAASRGASAAPRLPGEGPRPMSRGRPMPGGALHEAAVAAVAQRVATPLGPGAAVVAAVGSAWSFAPGSCLVGAGSEVDPLGSDSGRISSSRGRRRSSRGGNEDAVIHVPVIHEGDVEDDSPFPPPPGGRAAAGSAVAAPAAPAGAPPWGGEATGEAACRWSAGAGLNDFGHRPAETQALALGHESRRGVASRGGSRGRRPDAGGGSDAGRPLESKLGHDFLDLFARS